MSTAATLSVVESAHISELLEVAASILRRHHDQDLAQKTFVLQGYLELSKAHP
jgi:hypothetical protein